MTTQNSAPRPPRALIAMSGGVDSSVAAWLMQRDGYDCTGITMRLTHNEMLGQSGFHTCCSEKDIEDAARWPLPWISLTRCWTSPPTSGNRSSRSLSGCMSRRHPKPLH